MTLSGDPANDVLRLRQHASQLVDRLGLTGFDNASILAADAWVDSAEFRGAAQHGDAMPSVEVGAYLGEAIIRRHGGSCRSRRRARSSS